MRLFLTLEASGLKDQSAVLKKLKISLDKKNIDHQWIKPELWHIPLGSFGEMGRESWTEFSPRIKVLADRSPFKVSVDGLKAFPEPSHARIIWMDVHFSKELRALHSEAQEFLTADEHEFRPTLPIVRLKNHKNVMDPLSPYKSTEFGEITLDTFHVYDMVAGGPYPVMKLVEEFTFLGQKT
jgi:2'-5' RNA ligase